MDGIHWITFFPFEINYLQVPLVVEFVVKKYKNGLKNKIFEFLEAKNINISIINSLFIIIGYIGDKIYLESIKIAIDNKIKFILYLFLC
ncbi:hypothetical protein D3C72_2287320 [compost metagenome]